eukprot:GHUV01024916.1.p1 GENE.GHUV01024916.1~~GHUV01024916.1.p1  ORF type:complete len:309 (+),score=79.08 GHUV01024916.1:252-1178(+)
MMDASEQPDEPSPALAEALTTANTLLTSSLAAGDVPWTHDEQLKERINAYRASIEGLSKQLEQLGDAADVEGEQQQQHTLHTEQPTTVPGIGQEGVDYTVGTADDLDPSEWQVPPHCIPIHANVTTFDWSKLHQSTQFDVIMMDPPWQLATANPTRGVALGYSQLTDHDICQLPIPQLQTAGFLFVWVINSKYKFTLDLFERWGYTLVDEVVWVKLTVNRRLFKSHGYYLQHAKEVCMVAVKDTHPAAVGPSSSSSSEGSSSAGLAALNLQRGGVGSDVILSERRGQSQKPEEIYELIEALVPNGGSV